MEWYQKDAATLSQELSTDAHKGLTGEQVTKKLEEYGKNELAAQEKKPFITKLAEQFMDPMVIILIVAAVLSGILGDWVEAIIIIAIVIINAALGLYQEGKAEEAIAALQKMSSPEAKVIRDGKLVTVPSTELVPGDVIELETGDIVPADLRLVESSNMQIDESSLTGESVAVEKDASIVYDGIMEIGDRENTAYSSTIVTYGRGKGIVIETGHETEIGKIATTISSFEDEATPLQKKLAGLSKVLGILVVSVAIIVFAVGLLRGMPLLEVFMVAVSLAVAAIPEGMTAIVTIVLSLGMNRMAAKNAIVKKLLAVETLGTTTVICSDKTGTLTQNEMTVTKAYVDDKDLEVTGTGYAPIGDITIGGNPVDKDELKGLYTLMSIATLAGDANIVEEEGLYKCQGDPTEGALVTFAGKLGIQKDEHNASYPRIEEIPFDSDRKMMSTFHDNFIPKKIVSFTKGAPDIIIDRCTKMMIDGNIVDMTPELKKKALAKNSELARQALRVLAYAFRAHDELPGKDKRNSDHVENNMVFVGLTGMIDPPRPEVKAAIAECKQAGIEVKMITGDYLETAFAIGKDLGIAVNEDEAIMGKELNTMTDQQIRDVVAHKNIFARVSPQNKVQIVTALKDNGHIAAMTGDGVNDAPAIKKADIGIAMGITGTDVAKNTAEVILTDDNFATIVHAVEEGRIIYSNIKKFVAFLLSCNIGEVLVIFIPMLLGWGTPLSPIQLLWLNLVTDSFPALALGMEQGEEDIMEQNPRDPQEPIIDPDIRGNIIVQAIAITLSVLIAYYLGRTVFFPGTDSHSIMGQETMAFTTLVFAELFRAYSSRSTKYTLAHIGVFSNPTMNKAVLASTALMLLVLFVPGLQDLFDVVPLPMGAWGVVLVCMFIPLIFSEVYKAIRLKK